MFIKIFDSKTQCWGSGSGTGSGSGHFPLPHKCVERTEKMPAKPNFNTKFWQKIVLVFYTEDGVPGGKLLEKMKKKIGIFLASLKSMKKRVGSGVGSESGSIHPDFQAATIQGASGIDARFLNQK